MIRSISFRCLAFLLVLFGFFGMSVQETFAQDAGKSDRFAAYRELYSQNEVSAAGDSSSAPTSGTVSGMDLGTVSETAAGTSPVSSGNAFSAFSSMGVPGFGAMAAPSLNVTAKVTVLPTSETPGKLEIFTQIPDGFKIYSLTQEAGGPFPTKLHLPKEIELQGTVTSSPEPHSAKDEAAWGDMQIETHSKSVSWTVTFHWKNADALPAQITGSVEAQMCDANSCLPPKKYNFNAAVPVQEKSLTEADGSVPAASQAPAEITADAPFAPGLSAAPEVPVPSGNSLPGEISAETSQAGMPQTGTVPAEIAPAEMDSAEMTPAEAAPLETASQASDPFQPTLKSAEETQAETLTSAAEPEVFTGLEWDGQEAETDYSLAVILLMAYLGGLILNLMPCVLPVIAPKLHSFIRQAGEARSRIFLLNVSYTFGLLTVLWLLAALSRIADLVTFLKKVLPQDWAQRLPEFQNMGWGQQFTYPEFVIFMIALVFVMGLSFLGVWEIPIPGMVASGKLGKMQRQEGFLGAYCMGILTTLLATPCVGPYLGPVFGWVMTQPVWISFLTFTVIGLGLATPYLTIGAFPVLIRFLPKPGEWMETLKEVMGFFFMGTVVWLFYVLPDRYTVQTLGLLTALWFACWLVGKTTLSGASREAVLAAWAAGILTAVLTGFALFSLDLDRASAGSAPAAPAVEASQSADSAPAGFQAGGTPADGAAQAEFPASNASSPDSAADGTGTAGAEMSGNLPENHIAWVPFSEKLVNQLRQEEKIIFIDFTGRWCATCQTNTKFAIETRKVSQFIKTKGISPVLADWSEPSEEIENYIKKMGRNSIPLIVIWIPGQEQPLLIDGLVSESKLLSALEFSVRKSLESTSKAK